MRFPHLYECSRCGGAVKVTVRDGQEPLKAFPCGHTDAVIYANRQDVVKLHLPMPHRFLPVYQDGPMSFQIPGIFRTGGVEVLRNGAFRYLDGI